MFSTPSILFRLSHRSSFGRASLAVLTVFIAGCATGELAMLATVSGGERVRVAVDRGGARSTEIEGLEVRPPSIKLTPEKNRLIYTFELSDKRRRALQSIRVEDISDASPVVLLDDAMPVATEGVWRAESRSIGPSEDALKWMLSIDNTVRVFRFTIVASDGRKVVVNQGGLFPNVIKSAVRQAFGEKY